jgi:dephospho-CoA kinase
LCKEGDETLLKIIGLTGGIGAGKSTVSSYLLSLGYVIIDADAIAREMVFQGSDALKAIETAFGREILLADGNLNRPKLAHIIFSSADKRHALDCIMHPRIIEVVRGRLEYYKGIKSLNDIESADRPCLNDLIFIDAALLFESGLVKYVDEVWLVDAEDHVRIERLRIRDHISAAEALDRLRSQLPREIKINRADKIIDNSGTMKKLYSQIDSLLKDFS